MGNVSSYNSRKRICLLGRHSHDDLSKGEKQCQALLTEKKVRVNKHILKENWYKLSQREIGKIFGVRKNVINEIHRGNSWKHVVI